MAGRAGSFQLSIHPVMIHNTIWTWFQSQQTHLPTSFSYKHPHKEIINMVLVFSVKTSCAISRYSHIGCVCIFFTFIHLWYLNIIVYRFDNLQNPWIRKYFNNHTQLHHLCEILPARTNSLFLREQHGDALHNHLSYQDDNHFHQFVDHPWAISRIILMELWISHPENNIDISWQCRSVSGFGFPLLKSITIHIVHVCSSCV